MNGKRLTAQFEFDEYGELKAVLLGASSDREEKVLRRALTRLILPSVWDLLSRLLPRQT